MSEGLQRPVDEGGGLARERESRELRLTISSFPSSPPVEVVRQEEVKDLSILYA